MQNVAFKDLAPAASDIHAAPPCGVKHEVDSIIYYTAGSQQQSRFVPSSVWSLICN